MFLSFPSVIIEASLGICGGLVLRPKSVDAQVPLFFQLYVYIYFFRFFSIIAYYKILNIVPCAMQLVLVVYLFCI